MKYLTLFQSRISYSNAINNKHVLYDYKYLKTSHCVTTCDIKINPITTHLPER